MNSLPGEDCSFLFAVNSLLIKINMLECIEF